MNRSRAAIARVMSFVAALAFTAIAGATTVTALPGSTPQQTQVFSFFPVPIGVVVRDDWGNPIANAPVTFYFPSPGMFVPDSRNTWPTVMTDENGVAIPKPGVVASNAPGTYSFTVGSPQGSASFELTITAGGPASMFAYSGSGQVAAIGTTYPQPWRAQVLDSAGNPVPYAAVQFYADPAGPSGLFEGVNSLVVAADANGVATSPPFTANFIEGPGDGIALAFSGLNDPSIFAFFTYTNLPPSTIYFMDYTDSVAVGTTSFIAWRAVVVDSVTHASRPGVHFVYATDPSCGSFGGSATYEGYTDAQGAAWSPFFEARSLTLACATSLTVDGIPSRDLSVHVFSPANVVMTPQPAAQDTVVSRTFSQSYLMTESGLPVNAFPIQVSVSSSPSGSSASIQCCAFQALNTGIITVPFIANDKQGHYDIRATYNGSTAVTVPVTQRAQPKR